MRLFNIITTSRGHDIEAEELVVEEVGSHAVATLLVSNEPVAVFTDPESITSVVVDPPVVVAAPDVQLPAGDPRLVQPR